MRSLTGAVERRHVDARAEHRLVHRHRQDGRCRSSPARLKIGCGCTCDGDRTGRPPVRRVARRAPAREAGGAIRRRRRPGWRTVTLSLRTVRPCADACRAPLPRLPAGPAASRAGLREHHVPARPADLARSPWQCAHCPSCACRRPDPAHDRHDTCRVTTTWRSTPRTASANEIVSAAWISAPRLRTPLVGPRTGMQHLGEQLRERRRLGSLPRHREIELRELERLGFAIAAGASPAASYCSPPMRIDQRLVRLGDALEHRLGARGHPD